MQNENIIFNETECKYEMTSYDLINVDELTDVVDQCNNGIYEVAYKYGDVDNFDFDMETIGTVDLNGIVDVVNSGVPLTRISLFNLYDDDELVTFYPDGAVCTMDGNWESVDDFLVDKFTGKY